jgi:predicted metal-dependent HD superfamily phosphohydrolase
VLGADGPRYAAYAADVRAEYAHVDDAAFRLGRSAVLRALLERPSLYATATGRGRWEARARANVEQELSRLAVGPDDAAPPP